MKEELEWDGTYYGNRYSFAFPSPDCKAATKKKKSTVEKNVYASQNHSHHVKENRPPGEKKNGYTPFLERPPRNMSMKSRWEKLEYFEGLDLDYTSVLGYCLET